MIIRRGRVALAAALATALAGASLAAAPAASAGGGKSGVFPSLRGNLVSYYDFEHPVPGDAGRERDLGRSGTTIDLVNGGAALRVRDGSRGQVLQLGQVDPTTKGNDDRKAGVYSATGVPSLHAFNAARGATVMGWFKMTGVNPSPNSNTANPDDVYNAVGLAGLLSGTSQGHDVRALLEVIDVSGTLRVVALGRRVDSGSSQTFAANEHWRSVLPQNRWVHLAATFDYDTGAMALYKDGEPLPGFYTVKGDPWKLADEPGPHTTSATDPRGIKIGGSYPQNTSEGNPCNCRVDGLMFLDRAISPWEARHQYKMARH
ncbi:LamG-like jellyroll fold domain-containing protein [Actinomadura atramentaria]|uniref:LamG-like jellyroll fold domain-containing protein n=1 Tax=Actinomadura atramentaria TaxID=1990 RepID=UPI00039E7883|nr:LamG-like jellyroll fold domain-containing protein [Actinomadura atramentaria]